MILSNHSGLQKKHTHVLLVLLFILFFMASTFYTRSFYYTKDVYTNNISDAITARKNQGYLFRGSSENLTRRQAAVNYIAALQLKDGAFVSALDAPEEEEGSAQGDRAIRTLALLNGLDSIDKDKLIKFISERQLSDGGVVGGLDYSHEPEELGVAYDIAYILAQLNALDSINRTALINWVLGCYHPEDGHFSSIPKSQNAELYERDYSVFHTVIGLLALYWLHALNLIDIGLSIDYILSCYQQDGGFSVAPQVKESDYSTTEWCVRALYRLNALYRIDREKTINYVLQFYNITSQEFIAPGPPLTSACRGTIILGMLHATDRINRTKIIDLILSCQSNQHGGFTDTFNKSSEYYEESLDTTYMAVMMLSALGALDRLNEPFLVLYEPVWHGKPYTPHEENQDANYREGHPGMTESEFISGVVALVLAIILTVYDIHRRRQRKQMKPKKLYLRKRLRR